MQEKYESTLFQIILDIAALFLFRKKRIKIGLAIAEHCEITPAI